MFHCDSNLYSHAGTPLDSTKHFFENILPQLGWKTSKEETVIDIGCGTGMTTVQLVLPLFPNLKKIVAFDILPNMIEHAQKYEHHPKIEHRVASIEDWSTISQWKDQITKAVSILCFQWVKKQREAFENVYNLLSPDGEAAFYFILQSWYYEAVLEISKDPKWNRFLMGVNHHIPFSHSKKYDATYYKKMMEEIGFTIIHLELNQRKDPYASDDVYKDFFSSLCVFLPYIPEEKKEEFQIELFQHCVKHNGRNSEGLPTHNAMMLELVVKK